MRRQLEQPDVSTIELPQILQALADPVRLRILRALSDGEEVSCADIFEQLEVHKSTVSHHYRVLREAGITQTVVDGRERFIQLRRKELDARFPGLIIAILAGI